MPEVSKRASVKIVKFDPVVEGGYLHWLMNATGKVWREGLSGSGPSDAFEISADFDIGKQVIVYPGDKVIFEFNDSGGLHFSIERRNSGNF